MAVLVSLFPVDVFASDDRPIFPSTILPLPLPDLSFFLVTCVEDVRDCFEALLPLLLLLLLLSDAFELFVLATNNLCLCRLPLNEVLFIEVDGLLQLNCSSLSLRLKVLMSPTVCVRLIFVEM